MVFCPEAAPWVDDLRDFKRWVQIVSWLWNHQGHLHRHRHRGEKFFAPTNP